jgi:hypothetical protein
MTSRTDSLLDRISKLELERELEADLRDARARWRYRVRAGRLRFERDARLAHASLKQSIPQFVRESRILNLLTAPIIYSMIVPIGLLDLWFSLYQAICFRAYGIALVRRSAYIVIDRHHLAYLNGIEKLNCVYCGYANGVLSYVREITARTEQYWCPIRHASRIRAPHAHYRHFIDYGNALGYRTRLMPLRNALRARPRAAKGVAHRRRGLAGDAGAARSVRWAADRIGMRTPAASFARRTTP